MTDSIFKDTPEQWGWRGDPYLWRELAQYFSNKEMPNVRVHFEQAVIEAVRVLTGGHLDTGKDFYVERYDFGGGMSSGCVNCRFWLETAIPLLWQRRQQIQTANLIVSEAENND